MGAVPTFLSPPITLSLTDCIKYHMPLLSLHGFELSGLTSLRLLLSSWVFMPVISISCSSGIGTVWVMNLWLRPLSSRTVVLIESTVWMVNICYPTLNSSQQPRVTITQVNVALYLQFMTYRVFVWLVVFVWLCLIHTPLTSFVNVPCQPQCPHWKKKSTESPDLLRNKQRGQPFSGHYSVSF